MRATICVSAHPHFACMFTCVPWECPTQQDAAGKQNCPRCESNAHVGMGCLISAIDLMFALRTREL